MLSPEKFRSIYPPKQLSEELPESPISSLRQIQYLYGKLYTLATAGGGEYAPYLTPDAASDLIDTDDSLLVVRVDLTGENPELAHDERGPIWVTRYSDDLVEKVAHCYYQNRGSGIDHSITHKSGKNKSAERLGEYAKHRFTRWPSEDAIELLSNQHPDGWILDTLNDIGDTDTLTATIKDEVQHQLSDGQTSLITVKLKLDPDGDYRWPSEIEVLMEGMRKQRLSKLVSKNKASDSSGESIGLITGERTRTVGTAQDPLNYFLGKQVEKFPGLDIEEAWRTHSISEEAAVTVMNAETFVEACTYRTFGAKVYYLPYFFGQLSPDDVYELYGLLYQAANEDNDTTSIEDAYDVFGGTENETGRLRFYVSAVLPKQRSRYDVFGETLNGRLLYPRDLARHHNRIVSKSTTFNSKTDWTSPLPTNKNWDLLVESREALHSVSSGWYFYQTFSERDDEEADADDPRIEALVSVLGGDSIAVETILEEYVSRIITDEDDDDIDGFPSFRVASQFAQLCALATAERELLTTTDPDKEPITAEPNYEEHTMTRLEEITITDGGHPAATKLESFIENTPALAHDEDEPINDQRRGAFMLGALVGEVGSYQEYSEDRSTALVDQFPVKSITQSRVKKVTREAIGKMLTYTRQEKKSGGNFPGTKFEHVVEELRETIIKPDPDDWEIDTEDLRFYYALGVTYGLNDHPEWDNTQTDDTEEDI